MITQEQLKARLRYEPETGKFFSKGRVVGCINKDGYVQIHAFGRTWLAHRLAWLYVYGEFPRQEIDHIDQVKTNNQISNLRDVSRQENARNILRPKSHNKLCILGISKYGNRYTAQIGHQGRKIKLGYFANLNEAMKCYQDAKKAIADGTFIG